MRPLPKAGERKGTGKRRKLKSAVLIDSPNRKELEEVETRRKVRKISFNGTENIKNKKKKVLQKVQKEIKKVVKCRKMIAYMYCLSRRPFQKSLKCRASGK